MSARLYYDIHHLYGYIYINIYIYIYIYNVDFNAHILV